MAPNTIDYAELVQEARAFRIPPLHRRRNVEMRLPSPKPFNLVHAITGVRRCGKTFYAFQLMEALLDAGVPRDAMFYFNFADDRLRPAPATLLNDVIEEYWRQVPEARRDGCYLFLDEVQEAEGWEGFCQRIAERENVTLVVTGSSSKLSADEIASRFRGRLQEHPMFPLSFREYCDFAGIEAPDAEALRRTDAVSPQERTELEGAYERYLVTGGFPAVQHMTDAERIFLLQAYVRDVVVRDVVDRYPRVGIDVANQVALYALRNTGCELSVNTLVDALRGVGYATSWATVNEATRLLEQAHLVTQLKQYSTSFSPRTTALSKVYAVDPGMAHAVSRASQQDVGKRLETAVFNELGRRNARGRIDTVTSFEVPKAKGQKVDFLVGDALSVEPYGLVQVTVEMSRPATRARELSSLELAMGATRSETGLVVSMRERSTMTVDAGVIEVYPAWQWSLLDA